MQAGSSVMSSPLNLKLLPLSPSFVDGACPSSSAPSSPRSAAYSWPTVEGSCPSNLVVLQPCKAKQSRFNAEYTEGAKDGTLRGSYSTAWGTSWRRGLFQTWGLHTDVGWWTHPLAVLHTPWGREQGRIRSTTPLWLNLFFFKDLHTCHSVTSDHEFWNIHGHKNHEGFPVLILTLKNNKKRYHKMSNTGIEDTRPALLICPF